MKKSLFILIAIIGIAITAEAQQFRILVQRQGIEVRIRVKSFPACNNGNGCEATLNPGIGQFFGFGQTIVNSCNTTNQFGNAGVQVFSPMLGTFVSFPVVGMCIYPLSTGLVVPGIVGTITVQYIPGATPIIRVF
jgi:hypothetical protein